MIFILTETEREPDGEVVYLPIEEEDWRELLLPLSENILD